MQTLASRLKRFREAKGIDSAERFAHQLRMNPHAYRKYERGQSEPNFETLLQMCDILGVTPNDLLLPPSRSSRGRKRDPNHRPSRAPQAA